MASGHGLEPRHFYRRHRSVETFVADGAARTCLRLFPIVGSEDAEGDGYARFERGLLQSAGRFARDVVEMGRVPANHRSQRNDGIEIAALRKFFRRERQFKSSGNVKHFLALCSRFSKSFARARQQFLGDGAVESCDQNGKAEAIRHYDLLLPAAGVDGRDIGSTAEFLVDPSGTVRWRSLNENGPEKFLEAAKSVQ